jgi:hypothetical protein
MPDEPILRQKAREAVQQGKLPARRPDPTWGGPGFGAHCTICGLPVVRDEVESEIEFARDGEPGVGQVPRPHSLFRRVGVRAEGCGRSATIKRAPLHFVLMETLPDLVRDARKVREQAQATRASSRIAREAAARNAEMAGMIWEQAESQLDETRCALLRHPSMVPRGEVA